MSPEPASHARQEFEEVAFEHLPALHSFALRLSHHGKDAEDLVQETYLRAYRFWSGFERGTNLKAWLFRILKNIFINDYRRRKAQPVQVDFDKLDEVWEARISDPSLHRLDDPEQALERSLLAEDIDDALKALPDEYRMVAILCLIEGFSYQEAADALEIPIGTVMSRLFRSRKLLQARLLDQARERGFGSASPRPAGA